MTGWGAPFPDQMEVPVDNSEKDRKTPAASPDHPNESDDLAAHLKELGTTDPNFAKGLLGPLLSGSLRDATTLDVQQLGFGFAVVKGIKPRDELEAMHLAQMAGIHGALMPLFTQL